MAKNSVKLWAWNQTTRTLNLCAGHITKVIDAAICKADQRYAASYSDERIRVKGGNVHARELDGQKVIRA